MKNNVCVDDNFSTKNGMASLPTITQQCGYPEPKPKTSKRKKKVNLTLIVVIMVAICFVLTCIVAGLVLYRIFYYETKQPKPHLKKPKATLLAALTITDTKIWEIPPRAAACSSNSLD
jgi:heme/copper-type cytochrome/quinol oxidase subunit 2